MLVTSLLHGAMQTRSSSADECGITRTIWKYKSIWRTQTLKIEKNFEHKSLSLKQQKIKINVFKSSKVAFKQKNLAWAI